MRVAAAHDLDERLLRWTTGTQGEDTFESLILDVYRFQYERNAPYRRWCDRQGGSPDQVKHWHDVPAVPQSAFKEWTLCTFNVSDAVAYFESSGTTRDVRSRHYFDTLALYEHALLPAFRDYVLPDAARLDCVALVPDPEQAPHSSLAHMAGVVARECCGSVGYFVREGNVEIDGLVSALQQAMEPVLIFTTAFALVHLLDAMEQREIRLPLQVGSRIMETGGYKGQTREIPKPDLYAWASDRLGIPESHIVNEYGMCELSSQWYDTTLADAMRGEPSSLRHKAGPPWARARIIDPRTGIEAEEGETGLIRVYDPMNRGSVACIQTEDLGRAAGGGFEVLGRASEAELRGCSLMLDTFR